MQYEEYQRKIEKVASAIRFVLRHIVKITIALTAIMACVAALLVTRGMITNQGTCPETIIYGDDLDIGAKAFLSKVNYEYASPGRDNWSDAKPKLPGIYTVRAVTTGTFGYTRYSDIYTFKILPRPFTIIPADSFTYGDMPHVNIEGLVEGDSIDDCGFEIINMEPGSATVIADRSTVVIKNSEGKNVTFAYEIDVLEKTITMNSRPITVSVTDKTAEYNAQPLTSEEYEISEGSMADGDIISLTFANSIINVGEILNTPLISIVDNDGNDKSEYYTVKEKIGKLKITPRPLKVTTAENEWVYNEESYYDEGYTVDDGTPLIEGHTSSVVSHPEIIDAGSLDNELRLAIYGTDGEDLTENYAIFYTCGTLTVKPRPITVTTASNSWEYTDTAFSDNGFEISSETPVVSGHVFTVDTPTYITDVKESGKENVLHFAVRNENGISIDIANYEITNNYGTLAVTPHPISVTTASRSWMYTDQYQSDTSYHAEGLLPGHSLSAGTNTQTAIKYVGTVENVVNYKVVKGLYTDVSDNYEITYTYGELTITPMPIRVKHADVTKVYDGTPLDGKGQFKAYNLIFGHNLDAVSIGGGTDVGEYVLTPADAKVTDKDGLDVTVNYEITYEDGIGRVDPRPVTVLTNSASKLYDGTPLTDDGYYTESGKDSGLVKGHSIYVKVTGTVTEISEVDNTVDKSETRITDGEGSDVTSNYSISYMYGKLLVKALKFKLTTPDVKFEYDGTVKSSLEYTIDTEAFNENEIYAEYTVSVDTYTSEKNAGEYVNELIILITDQNGEDITRFFEIDYNYGDFIIEKKAVTVTTGDGEWIYDGLYHYNDAYTVEGIIATHTHKYLTITKLRDVLAVGFDDDIWHVYEDESYIYTGDIVTYTDIPDIDPAPGYDFLGAYNKIDVRIYDEDSNDVTDNYEITYNYGQLRILPRDITIITESQTIVYDGNKHYMGGQITVSKDTPLAEGDEAIVDANNSLSMVNVGEYSNTPRVVIYCPETDNFTDAIQSTSDRTYNYNITYIYGTISIIKREVTIQPYGEKKYDGYKIDSYSFRTTEGSKNTLVEGDAVSAKMESYPTEVGTWSCSIIAGTVKITDTRGYDVTANYDIKTESGEFTITPRLVEITSASGKKKYDGTPLINSEYVITNPDALASGHLLSVDITGTITLVGTAKNTFDKSNIKVYSKNNEDVTGNYIFNFVEGTLEVTPAAEVVIVTESKSKNYDGTPLIAEKHEYYTLSGNIVSGERVEITVIGSQTDPGKSANTAKYSIIDKNGNDVTSCYTIKEKFGILEVTMLNIDTDGDGEPDLNIDTDSDGKPDINIDTNGDGTADKNIDTDGDGIADKNLDDGSGSSASAGQLDTSGKIQSALGSGSDSTVCYIIRSSENGTIYLRFKSFGNYNGQGFNEANPYHEYLYSKYSALYLSSYAINEIQKQAATVEIISRNGQYLLPYYALPNESGSIQKSDVLISGDASAPYTLSYLMIGNTLNASLPMDIVIYEQKYREFVYANYLSIDDETLEFMKDIIYANGFDASNNTIVGDVANFISNCATYNLSYDRSLDSKSNIVISFLSEYKEGICQHYAASAVMLYRALGIPARYTTGFVAHASAGELVEVTAANAHAWVEIYIDGVGWIMVEVTGSSNPDVSAPDWSNTEVKKDKITVTPKYQYKIYDGTPLYAQNSISPDMLLQELIDQGYTYSVSVSGSRTEVGRGISYIEAFTLYDKYGNDVTDSYEIIYDTGVIEIAYGVIKIFLYEIQKYYDGTDLSYGEDDYEIITDIPYGMEVYISLSISMKNVGWLKNSDINNERDKYIEYNIYHNGIDVSDNIIVIADVFDGMSSDDYIPIRIDKRTIELTSASASKRYDGTVLRDQDVYITKGHLATGDTLYAYASGSVTDKGSVNNTINSSNVRIVNSRGEDVTDNYEIIYNEGILTIL